ncbi:major facilitator superfamily domain-containing protein [Coprinopsis sp. MPI-PUGE-AT-0042]|nr:major facilitator superfamily domain-containing protein [Coprinopsis sp. MPI-PUGE-AT-0042]
MPSPSKASPHGGDDNHDRDPRRLPTARCLSDPAVQANAAKLQAIITTTMGLLSAFTTGWWGRFGERYGRTKVLAVATFGLLWTDLVFILTSTPHLPFPLSWFSYTSKFNHAHHLLLLAPLVEGLLGGWSTLQSATSAYISDCTSPGSRAQIFSRFTGVFYLGFSFGPAIAAWLIRHPDFFRFPGTSEAAPGKHLVDLTGKTVAQRQTVTAVFWIAVFCSLANFLLVLFLFPESLTKEKREQAKRASEPSTAANISPNTSDQAKGEERRKALRLPVTGVEDADGVGIGAIMDVDEITSPITTSFSASFLIPKDSEASVTPPEEPESFLMSFMRPLAVFLPVYVDMPTRNGLTVRRRKDYSLTLLAGAMLAWMLSSGVYQIKYLYAGHTYKWGAERLSYYISFTGAARALFLLLILPFLITTFKSKPKPVSPVVSGRKGKSRASHDERDVEASPGPQTGHKPAPSRMELGKAIRFDLRLTRFSLLVDILGNMIVAVAPSPILSSHGTFGAERGHPHQHHHLENIAWEVTSEQSQMLFVFASALNSFASGMVPAVHSLALCVTQARALEADFGSLPHDDESYDEPSVSPSSSSVAAVDTGTLFGAFAILQAVGQMILGPMLFGIVYSSTVASHPKTIFAVATGLLVFSLVLVAIVKNPVGEYRLERRQKKFRRRMEAGYGAHAVSIGSTGTTVRKGRKGKNWEQEIERRGRTRDSKDLRGGAVGWRFGAGGSGNEQDGQMVARSA